MVTFAARSACGWHLSAQTGAPCYSPHPVKDDSNAGYPSRLRKHCSCRSHRQLAWLHRICYVKQLCRGAQGWRGAACRYHRCLAPEAAPSSMPYLRCRRTSPLSRKSYLLKRRSVAGKGSACEHTYKRDDDAPRARLRDQRPFIGIVDVGSTYWRNPPQLHLLPYLLPNSVPKSTA